MTIIEILTDLEAKAKQIDTNSPPHNHDETWARIAWRLAVSSWISQPYRDLIVACSPDRILVLVEYVRQVQDAALGVSATWYEGQSLTEALSSLAAAVAGHPDVGERT